MVASFGDTVSSNEHRRRLQHRHNLQLHPREVPFRKERMASWLGRDLLPSACPYRILPQKDLNQFQEDSYFKAILVSSIDSDDAGTLDIWPSVCKFENHPVTCVRP